MKEEFKIDCAQRDCSGCSACFATCPMNAISMKENDEGFLYPEIDSEKCTNCGLCSKICPVVNPKYSNTSEPDCYAAMANDEIRKDSSSGGMFPMLAYTVLGNGGYVAGAVWEGKRVVHIVSNKKEDVEKMRKSKYLQSSMENCYSDIKQLLEDDKEVLFTGTPCQVAGLKAYLRKDYEKLFTVEIICHGTPSPMVFEKYIDENLKDDEKFVNTDFRDKVNGWNLSFITTTTTNTRKFSFSSQTDTFLKVFLKNLCLRQSCGDCKFNKIPRQADLTIGDFWRIKKFSKKLDDRKGTSVLLVNNQKGQLLFDNIKNKLKVVKKVPIKYAIKGNPNLVGSSKFHTESANFFKLIQKRTLKETLDYCLSGGADCMILNYWFAVNYGAILTCYGVQCLAEKLGFSAKVINYRPNITYKYEGSFSESFANKYLNLTEEVKTYDDFVKLNNCCDNFIVGSDQVWRASIVKTHSTNVTESIYLLDFVNNKNKKLSYAASFGKDYFDGDYIQENIFRHFIKQFDAISVRENDGCKILDKTFDVKNSIRLIDSVFLIPKEKLDDLTKEYKKEGKYIACFVLPYFKKAKWYKNFLHDMEDKLGLPIKKFNFDSKISVEEWLAYIKNSEFVITDSYHGTCFSIIFNRPFVQIKNSDCQSRFETLFQMLSIEDNSIDKNMTEIDLERVLISRDWDKINKRIEFEADIATKWFEDAIKAPKKDFSAYNDSNFMLIKSQLDMRHSDLMLFIHKNYRKIYCKYYLMKILRVFLKKSKRKALTAKIKEYKTLRRIYKKI